MNQMTRPGPIPIDPKELPLACPREAADRWRSHPRVYLPLDGKAPVSCPYCGTRYSLKEGD